MRGQYRMKVAAMLVAAFTAPAASAASGEPVAKEKAVRAVKRRSLAQFSPRHTPKISGRPPIGWRRDQARRRSRERMRRQNRNRKG